MVDGVMLIAGHSPPNRGRRATARSSNARMGKLAP